VNPIPDPDPTEVGPPERDKTDGSQELNDGWVRSRSASNRIILKYNGISQINGSYGFCQNWFVPR
jgi:hypothetical protein